MISDIYYDKPWGASSSDAGNINNEYQYEEGENGRRLP
jgi:hypothetical protein